MDLVPLACKNGSFDIISLLEYNGGFWNEVDLVPLACGNASFDTLSLLEYNGGFWNEVDLVPLACEDGSFDIILFIRILWWVLERTGLSTPGLKRWFI